ncbi:MAG: helix-turn-helix transcriptional regulator [Ruminococcaceae bacterium]|nr:helix-turn-helix transcriptional regulator [Oscillospiraceae bacterium]
MKVGVNVLNYELLGRHIRKQRKEKKYTLEQLAEKLDVSTTFIGQIERAKGIPSLETLVKIANVLEISIDSLLFGDLNNKSGNNYFVKKVAELTETFSPKEKELLLKNIEIINEYRNNAE